VCLLFFCIGQENDLAEAYRSQQETVNNLTSQLSEQTSLGEMLHICDHVMHVVNRLSMPGILNYFPQCHFVSCYHYFMAILQDSLH